jgi:hypothetical protein
MIGFYVGERAVAVCDSCGIVLSGYRLQDAPPSARQLFGEYGCCPRCDALLARLRRKSKLTTLTRRFLSRDAG